MNAAALIWAGVRHRPLPHLLHMALMGFATGLIVLMMLVSHQLQQRAARDAAAVDMVIGAPGSALQLVLAAVYHVDNPTGNIAYEAAQRWAQHRLVARAVPIALGDSVRGFRIVGTTADFYPLYRARLAEGHWPGRLMDAVVGAEVAEAGFRVSSRFAGAHGLEPGGHDHDEQPYRVVGRLAATGTVLDRLIITSLESVWALHGEGDHVDEHDDDGHDHDLHDLAHADARPEEKAPAHDRPGHIEPVAAGREVTALLIRYRSSLAAATLPREVAQTPGLMAATPAQELLRLRVLADGLITAAQAFAVALVLLAALGMLAALNSALESRRYDLAVMRALGATRWRVVRLLWTEAVVLALLGTLLGSVIARGVVAVMGAHLPGRPLTGWAWVPAEAGVFLLALMVASIAVALPALRAYRVDVAGVLSRA